VFSLVIDNHVPQPINLYPNPVTEQCFITVNHKADTANLLDATGQLVQSVTLQRSGTTSSGTIDMSGQDAGLYLVEIPIDNGLETARLIKQ